MRRHLLCSLDEQDTTVTRNDIESVDLMFGKARLCSVDESPEAHSCEGQGDASDSSLSTPHPERAFADKNLRSLILELIMPREIAVYP